MSMLQSTKALLVLAAFAALPAHAADVPPKGAGGEQAAITKGTGAAQEPRLGVSYRYRTLRHVRAMTIRRCVYLGCPGSHVLGIGF